MLQQEKKVLESRLSKVQGNLDTAEQIIRELSGEMKTLQVGGFQRILIEVGMCRIPDSPTGTVPEQKYVR